jgi:D-alanyl-D-alanine carboxypeptidase
VRILALPLALLAFHGSVQPLPPSLETQVRAQLWHPGCPVPLSRLSLLTVDYWGFDGGARTGRLVTSSKFARPLLKVFRRLYGQHFRIRRMGPLSTAADNTASFECRRASPSPCPGAGGSGNWSEHAYGEAVDINPIENPYTGCGRTRQRRSIPYLDRSRLRTGMVTPAVVAAFRSIGWGWGGNWTGVKDYMHFSASGH